MSVNQYREHLAQEQIRLDKGKRTKYNSRPTEVDGITFDSEKEARYYGQLKMRVRAGDLLKIEVHVTFPLVVNGLKVASYECDFVLHYPDGRREVVDVKSPATKEIGLYKLKKMLMKAIHGIEILEK